MTEISYMAFNVEVDGSIFPYADSYLLRCSDFSILCFSFFMLLQVAVAAAGLSRTR